MMAIGIAKGNVKSKASNPGAAKLSKGRTPGGFQYIHGNFCGHILNSRKDGL